MHFPCICILEGESHFLKEEIEKMTEKPPVFSSIKSEIFVSYATHIDIHNHFTEYNVLKIVFDRMLWIPNVCLYRLCQNDTFKY